MPFAAALLDLDGTLLNTIPDLADASNAMLAELGLEELPQEQVATYVGKGTPHLVARLLQERDTEAGRADPQARFQQALAAFLRHYHACNGRRAVLYPGVVEGLQAMRAQGMKLAIVTNKPTEFTPPLLRMKGLDAYFDHVVCGDTCAEKKPHPMPLLHACELLGVQTAQALAIGDSLNDAQAARAAGVHVLAVPYGYNEGASVHDLDVDAIVSSIEDAARWAGEH
ncbi:phosphoglycolate phosphatase [Candidimonas nitroreducens]|uniref:Phosphoglycolate phosphatase n=1 Tax=Candidimonas nitroreducens TaxID=683354 RepID=A0A225MD33_9BURK|nr:phosphoglycolate phosphatase [Candidimonas nitroreducens]OWT59225.1 phosphoglycolate phosphatase [Candidimonas nitroreducens]